MGLRAASGGGVGMSAGSGGGVGMSAGSGGGVGMSAGSGGGVGMSAGSDDGSSDDVVVSARGLFRGASDSSSSSRSCDGALDSLSGTAAGRRPALVAVGAFRLALPPGPPLLVVQEPARAIGFKVYPAALTLCDYLLTHAGSLGLRGALAVELGAGVCGLPSLVAARLGAAGVVATDLPEVLPLLAGNLRRNVGGGAGGDGGGCCVAAALPWGGPRGAAAGALRSAVVAAFGPAAPPVSLLLCADVVYHAHLIQPLLWTLLELTEAAPAPLILLAYVQRFKRAKRFFKLARHDFELTAVRTPDVVDYDSLAWRAEGDALELSTRSAYATHAAEAGVAAAAPLKSYVYTLTRRHAGRSERG